MTAAFALVLALLVSFALPHAARADHWQTGDPAALGMNTRALDSFRDTCRDSGADACLVAYRGRIVLEWYGPGYSVPAYTMSSVKSWTALLVGLALEDGFLSTIDEPAATWFPQWRAAAGAGVTIRHLLTMTAGLRQRQGRSGADLSIGYVGDKDDFVAALELDWEPGQRWAYSNEGVQALSPILTAAVGMPLDDYARRRLFRPLGMQDTRLHQYPPGQAWTCADAETSLRDFARIGQLVLDHGVHNGRQVAARSWIDERLKPSKATPRYGYLWWLHYDSRRLPLADRLRRALGLAQQPRGNARPVAYATHGNLNTDCYVLPDQGIVAARMQSRPGSGASAYDRDAAIRRLAASVPRRGAGAVRILQKARTCGTMRGP